MRHAPPYSELFIISTNVQNLLFLSCSLELKTTVHKTIILTIASSGGETRSLAVRQKKKRIEYKTEGGTGGWRILHNEERMIYIRR
jgi:hypothetical protein